MSWFNWPQYTTESDTKCEHSMTTAILNYRKSEETCCLKKFRSRASLQDSISQSIYIINIKNIHSSILQ